MIRVGSKAFKAVKANMKMVEKDFPKAFVSALNRSAAGIRTEAARKVREVYYVKHGDVLKKISVTKATTGRMNVLIASKDRPIRLINFSTTPKSVPGKPPRMLKAAVKREGGKKPIPGAFVAEVRGSHSGVFQRTKQARHVKTGAGQWSELPIDQLRGPAIPVMLSQPGIVQQLQVEAERRVSERLDHEIKRVLDRVKTT
jgi:hypothetical protein